MLSEAELALFNYVKVRSDLFSDIYSLAIFRLDKNVEFQAENTDENGRSLGGEMLLHRVHFSCAVRMEANGK